MSNQAQIKLEELERKIFSTLGSHHCEYVEVDLGTKEKIWTVSMNRQSKNTPLLLIHGYASGSALWCLNLSHLAKNRPVYAIDLPGFGRSSRPKFGKNCFDVERQMVDYMEAWRVQTKLEKFIIAGHSMGGAFATLYAMSHPDRIEHLLLIDTWGFTDRHDKLLCLLKLMANGLRLIISPCMILRVLGRRLAPNMLLRVDRKMFVKFGEFLKDDKLIPSYIYYTNCVRPRTGEAAFDRISIGFGWPKNGLIKRLEPLRSDVRMTFVFGEDTWMDRTMGDRVKTLRINSHVDIKLIPGTSHHPFCEKPDEFNELITNICQSIDKEVAEKPV